MNTKIKQYIIERCLSPDMNSMTINRIELYVRTALIVYVKVKQCSVSRQQGWIYYEANEASASGPHHLGGPHQNFNAVSKADFFIL